MSFIHSDFLLTTPTGRTLFHEYAEREPIFDYHCHLPPEDVAGNRQFRDLFEIWLEGDHYKWRVMRANGEGERYCTGDAPPKEKFLAWARTVPHTLRNPLFHWTHLELVRYFGIEELLDETTAESIWSRCNERLATPELRVWGIFRKFNVKAVCTVDDPTDDLRYHRQVAASDCPTQMFPTYRPDDALEVHQPDAFNPWVDKLGAAANVDIGTSYTRFLDALKQRHDHFHTHGCRLSDHGMNHCHGDFGTELECASIFERARHGVAANSGEYERFASHMMLHFGRMDAARGWTKQMHIGALRNNNTRRMRAVGPDSGFDSIGDFPQAESMAAYFDRLDQEGALPKVIVYNNNPQDNYVMATMLGNFQDGSIPGKMQFGSGWWYLDQKEAMEWQLNTLSNAGLLSRFIGMLTDSRSFLSFPRHEYFRRTLCNLVGRDVDAGEIPARMDWLGPMVRNICYENARAYLGLPMR